MRKPYLEVTFRKGQALAAYLYLPRRSGTKNVRTAEMMPGVLVDFGPQDVPLGLEITSPGTVRAADLNRLLKQLGQRSIAAKELAPLRLAA